MLPGNVFLFSGTSGDEETRALVYLNELDRKLSEKCFQAVEASWNYNTDINNINQEKQLSASLEYSKYSKELLNNLTNEFGSWKQYQDEDLKRRFSKTVILGASALPDEELVKVIFLHFETIRYKSKNESFI